MFTITYCGHTIKVLTSVTTIFLEDCFGLATGSVIGVRLSNGLEVDLSNPTERLMLSDKDTELVLAASITNNRMAPSTTAERKGGINWTRATRMSLYGGTGGIQGESEYRAPNGTVVKCTAPTYFYVPFYYMEYLFKLVPPTNDHADYWLTDSRGSQTLSIVFPSPIVLAKIRVCATADARQELDRGSDYMISIKTTTGTKMWQITPEPIDTSRDALGQFHEHVIEETGVTSVEFFLTQRGRYGVTLRRIEFLVIK